MDSSPTRERGAYVINAHSRTPDRDFRCYSRSISHKHTSQCKKTNKHQPHVGHKLVIPLYVTSLNCKNDITMSHFSDFKIFFRLFHVFQIEYKFRYFMVSKK